MNAHPIAASANLDRLRDARVPIVVHPRKLIPIVARMRVERHKPSGVGTIAIGGSPHVRQAASAAAHTLVGRHQRVHILLFADVSGHTLPGTLRRAIQAGRPRADMHGAYAVERDRRPFLQADSSEICLDDACDARTLRDNATCPIRAIRARRRRPWRRRIV